MNIHLLVLMAWTAAHASLGSRPEPTPAGSPRTLRAQPGVAAPRATLKDAAWLEGAWLGEGLGGEAEEVWSGARGGAMVGHFRSVSSPADGSVVRFYELMTIVESNGSLVLRLKHFNPDLSGWEEKDRTVDFPLVALGSEGDQALYFAGLTYRRHGDGIVAWVAIQGRDGVREEGFTFRRRRSSPSSAEGPDPGRR
jgi:hypothetical protein